jgi:hypothetical protein
MPFRTVSAVDGGTVLETFAAAAGGVILFETSPRLWRRTACLLGLGPA